MNGQTVSYHNSIRRLYPHAFRVLCAPPEFFKTHPGCRTL
ncbi:hypothetical protein BRYFOR_05313 [Marvinbryantia formatexigens DSM 14469]|uniref:Uncharacterized protein n=1 Tax=Marvinbryantia formatexigens DSM 14469 TaxID=478749 RepID=C6L9M3_9FIRM|nr:hypothetical protein BRYFOR_05313 [Marvinbryantia formatexigens DSM 14469]